MISLFRSYCSILISIFMSSYLLATDIISFKLTTQDTISVRPGTTPIRIAWNGWTFTNTSTISLDFTSGGNVKVIIEGNTGTAPIDSFNFSNRYFYRIFEPGESMTGLGSSFLYIINLSSNHQVGTSGDFTIKFGVKLSQYSNSPWEESAFVTVNVHMIVQEDYITHLSTFTSNDYYVPFQETVLSPSIPTGPSSGKVGQSLSFSTGGSYSNLGHSVEYQFDWGDGSVSSWGSATQSHSYSSTGIKNVKARTRCQTHTSVVSGWSATKSVNISYCILTINISPSGSGNVSKNPDKTNYSYNESIQLTANANSGYQFDHWGGNLSGSDTYKTITTDGDKSVTAYFTQLIETISTPNTPSGPSIGKICQSLSFSTGGSSSNLGHSVDYQFDWGDGSFSSWSSATQSHSYSSTGIKNIKARAHCQMHTSIVSGWSNIRLVSIYETPQSDFSAERFMGPVSMEVHFSDQSAGNVTNWSWVFGDGESSTQQSPTHIYIHTGQYTVSLTVSGPGGSDTETKQNCITIYDEPSAGFTVDLFEGSMPLEVHFSDQSAGNVTSWSWDFGDGESSTQQNPTHIYQHMGQYTTSLTVAGPGGSDTETKQNYINVYDSLLSNVIVSILDTSVEMSAEVFIPVQVTDLTDLEIVSYEFCVSFDQNVLKAKGISLDKTISSDFIMPIANLDQPGRIFGGSFGLTPLSDSGILIYLIFNIIGSEGSSTYLNFDSFVFNAGRPNTIVQNGIIKLGGPSSINIYNDDKTPGDYFLSEGYPNPFNSTVNIQYGLPLSKDIELSVFDLLGRKIKVLLKGFRPQGIYQASWNGTNFSGEMVPSGLYFIIFQCEKFNKVIRVNLIR